MTTRKELIERIQAMQLGTQEMIDAAKDDATRIPFDTLFLNKSGEPVWRTAGVHDDFESVKCVGVCEYEQDYLDASHLLPMTED